MSKPWTAVPNAAACDNTLSVNARLLYVILRTYAWNRDGEMKVWPSCETLADQMGVSVSTTKRAIKELEDRRLITRKERKGTSSLTYIHDPGEVTSDPTKMTGRVTHDTGGRSPMTHEVPSIEVDKDPAQQKTERDITCTEDEGDYPSEMLPPSNRLRSGAKKSSHHSKALGIFLPLARMWDESAVNLGYEERPENAEKGILPQVIKAYKATGNAESPLNDPDAILAGLRKRADSKDDFWQGQIKFKHLFCPARGGGWLCVELAHEGKLKESAGVPGLPLVRPSEETMSRPGAI